MKGIIFAQLAFDDETSSLWAIDTSDRIYFYHPKHYWMKIEGSLSHISNGRNRVWGVNKQGQVYRRIGITDEYPEGTAWMLVAPAGLGKISYLFSLFHFHSHVFLVSNQEFDQY